MSLFSSDQTFWVWSLDSQDECLLCVLWAVVGLEILLKHGNPDYMTPVLILQFIIL